MMGANGTLWVAGAELGKKLDLAAVEATAGGKEGTVICANLAEGRAARTGWSDATGVTGVGATEASTASLF